MATPHGSKTRESWLLVGARSHIAQAMDKHLLKRGAEIWRTTRDGKDGTIKLALPDDIPELPAATPLGTAILFAAITGHAACEADRDWTRKVNVISMMNLFDTLVNRGWNVIFLSSEAALPTLHDSLNRKGPRSEYGFQKHLVERHVGTYGAKGSVLRLSKVVNPSRDPWVSWLKDLGQAKSVEAYADYHLSPLAACHAATAISAVARARRGGIWQASGAECLSYFEFLVRLQERLLLEGQVLPTCATASGDHSFTPTAMETTRLAKMGLWLSPTTDDVCDAISKEIQTGRSSDV